MKNILITLALMVSTGAAFASTSGGTHTSCDGKTRYTGCSIYDSASVPTSREEATDRFYARHVQQGNPVTSREDATNRDYVRNAQKGNPVKSRAEATMRGH